MLRDCNAVTALLIDTYFQLLMMGAIMIQIQVVSIPQFTPVSEMSQGIFLAKVFFKKDSLLLGWLAGQFAFYPLQMIFGLVEFYPLLGNSLHISSHQEYGQNHEQHFF